MRAYSSLTFAEVALAWLRFPPRIGSLVRIPGAERWSPMDHPVVMAFVEEIALQARSRTIDEVQHVISNFFATYADLARWWTALVSGDRIDFVFDNGEPRLDADDIGAWRKVTTSFDPDTLVALVFASRYRRRCEPGDLFGWGTVVGSQNSDVRRLFLDRRMRIYDTHVHLEGCEPIPLLWQRVLSGELKPSHFEQYRGTSHGSNASSAEREIAFGLGREKAAIARALEAFRSIRATAGRLFAVAAEPPASLFTHGVNAAALWPERRFLTAVWAELSRARETNDERTWSEWHELARSFDVYTQGKSAFLGRLTQGPEGNPGLAAFKRYFRRGKVLPKHATKGSRNPGRHTGEPSRRLAWERWCRMGRFASENPGIAGIEMRIAPLNRVADYVRFFQDFKRERSSFVSHPESTEVSFVIHFIRQEPSSPYLSPYKASKGEFGHALHLESAAVDDGEARSTIDRQSAVLHRFRTSYPELASLIVGIDVANVERRNPVHLFSPYLRMLRLRDGDLLPTGNPERYRRWADIVREDLHIVPTGMAPLGLTFHVGEDFFHPLDGVKAVWEYMNFCDVRNGDRIGHGLALGIDIPRFNAERGRSAVMPVGEALDLLSWMRHRLSVLPGTPQIALRKIEDDLSDLSQRIYGARQSPGDLYELVRARHSRPRDVHAAPSTVLDLMRSEGRAATAERRNDYAALPESLLREDLAESLTALQDQVVQEVIERGLYVEVNPSSNVNILGVSSMGEHPLFLALKKHPTLRITVNTDDPGTFATSLELEYALARESLRENGFNRVERHLEWFGRCSEHAAFSTPPHRRLSQVSEFPVRPDRLDEI